MNITNLINDFNKDIEALEKSVGVEQTKELKPESILFPEIEGTIEKVENFLEKFRQSITDKNISIYSIKKSSHGANDDYVSVDIAVSLINKNKKILDEICVTISCHTTDSNESGFYKKYIVKERERGSYCRMYFVSADEEIKTESDVGTLYQNFLASYKKLVLENYVTQTRKKRYLKAS